MSSGETTTTRLTCGSRIRATSQQLPVTSNATRSDATRLSASVSKTLRVCSAPDQPSDDTVLADRDHTELAMNIQADRATDPSRRSQLSPPQLVLHRAGEPAGQRHRPIRAPRLNPGKSQGRPNEKHGLEAHRSKRPTRLRSPKKAPVPDRPNLRSEPDGPPNKQFHASRRGPAQGEISCQANRSRLVGWRM